MTPVDPRVDPRLVPAGSRPKVMGELQKEFDDLPSIRTPDCQIITRWALTDEEKAAIIRGEDIYLTILSCESMQPVIMTVGPIDWTATMDALRERMR
jgi:hypothetical protein